MKEDIEQMGNGQFEIKKVRGKMEGQGIILYKQISS